MKGRRGKAPEPKTTIAKSVVKAARVRLKGGHYGDDAAKHGGQVSGKSPRARPDKRARGGGIHINPKHKGLLHKELGVPEGEKIPMSKIKTAEHSPDPAKRKRAYFADTAKTKFKH